MQPSLARATLPHRAVHCSLLPRFWPLAQTPRLPFALRPIFLPHCSPLAHCPVCREACFWFYYESSRFLITMYSTAVDCLYSLRLEPSLHLSACSRFASFAAFEASVMATRCLQWLSPGLTTPCLFLLLFFVFSFSAALLFCFPWPDAIALDHLPHFLSPLFFLFAALLFLAPSWRRRNYSRCVISRLMRRDRFTWCCHCSEKKKKKTPLYLSFSVSSRDFFWAQRLSGRLRLKCLRAI